MGLSGFCKIRHVRVFEFDARKSMGSIWSTRTGQALIGEESHR